MVNDIIKSLQADIEKAIEAFRRELGKVRTGRANLSILDGVRVEYYGTPTPLNQVASVSVADARWTACPSATSTAQFSNSSAIASPLRSTNASSSSVSRSSGVRAPPSISAKLVLGRPRSYSRKVVFPLAKERA